MTVTEVAQWWRSQQLHRPTTAALVELMLRRHVLPTFGDRDPASIRPSEVQAWVRDRMTVLAPASVEVAYRFFASMCAWAEADGLIERTPCRGIRLPRLDRAPVTPPTPAQVAAVVEAAPEPYRTVILVAVGTGLRQGECLGLGPEHVDFGERLVTVERQLVIPGHGAPCLAPPKTTASYRRVPLPDVVATALAAHLDRSPPGDAGLVFTNTRGRPISRHRVSEVWRRARAAAGVPPRVRFHDLRHFYASLLIRHGESVKVVQARLGHASATETLDTYAHLWPDSGEQTRAAVDEVLGG